MLNHLHIDRSVYHTVQDALYSGGVEISGILFLDQDILTYKIQQAEEAGVNLDTFDDSSILPAITVTSEDVISSPAALGGANWKNYSFIVGVYGTDPSMSKEFAEIIENELLRQKLQVYDYTVDPPEFINSFFVQKVRNKSNVLSSLTLLDSVKRDVSFDIVLMQ